MIGSFGCTCDKCKGSGTISMKLRARLCALERLLGVEIIVTRGYICKDRAEALNLSPAEKIHTMKDETGAGFSSAVDFYPRTGLAAGNRADSRGSRWGNRRYDFLEMCRPFFDNVWIVVNVRDFNKWSIHGEVSAGTEGFRTITEGED